MADAPFPRDVRPWADAVDPASSWGALYSAVEPAAPMHSHGDHRSPDDVSRVHRAGVRWAGTCALEAVRVRFADGCVPRRASLWVDGDPPRRLADLATRDRTVPVGASVSGVFVRQEAGGGSDRHPGRLRLERLSPIPSARPPLEIALHRADGGIETPAIPVAQDGDPRTVLDLSDASRIDVRSPTPVVGLRLVVPRVGTCGSPAWLRRWLRLDALLLDAGDAPIPCRRLLDARGAGVVGGTSVVRLIPERALPAVSVVLPTARPFVLALVEVAVDGSAPDVEEVLPAPGLAPVPRRARGPDPTDAWRAAGGTLEAAEALFAPVRLAASLGLPGTDARLGIAPDGGLLFRRGPGEYACVAFAVDGVRPGDEAPWRARWAVPGRSLVREHDEGGLRIEQRFTVAAGRVDLVVRLRAPRRERRVKLTAASADFAWTTPRPPGPWPLSPVEPSAWERSLRAGERTLTRELSVGREGVEVRFTIPLGPARDPDEAFARVLGARVACRLPGRAGWVDSLLAQAATFVRGNDRVRYGTFPSLYDPDVFGLEEETLLAGLALWGCTDAALRSFRATYLTAEHLDPAHYLHDLRFGIVAWQAERLLTLCGLGWSDLDAREQALIERAAAWVRERRAGTAGGAWEGEPVLPGLLPPHRYGGDVGFRTQSLSLDAVAAMGLRALADLRADPDLRAEAAAYRVRVLEVLDHLFDGERQALHTGREDPGDYFQLLACGVLAPLDLFGPGDAHLPRLLEQLEGEGRMALGMPRFDGWGPGESVDAVYGLGSALFALRIGDLGRFEVALAGLAAVAMDRDLHTFREVGPLGAARDRLPQCWLPGRRLDRTEPCLGALGVLLQLLRSAVVTELPDADGRLGRRLLVLGGVPASSWGDGPLELHGAPTRAGRVTVVARPSAGGLRVFVDAPGAEAVVIRGPDGALTEVAGGRHEVTL